MRQIFRPTHWNQITLTNSHVVFIITKESVQDYFNGHQLFSFYSIENNN